MRVGKVLRLGCSLFFTVIMGMLINYMAMPAMTFHSTGFWCFVLSEIIIFVLVYIISSVVKDGFVEDFAIRIVIGIAITGWVIIFIVTAIAGAEMVNAYKYQKIANIDNETSFEEDFMEVNEENLTIVDVETAKKLGNRTLGTISNMSSWYEVDDEYNLILINGEEYRISSINYGGFFKYNKAKNRGIPGYILVNAKTQESELVILDKPMKYSPSAFWRDNLTRHIHNEYPSYILAKSFFEVDDDGNPYWITGVITTTIGLRGGQVINSVIITDAVTGENTEYMLKDMPEWVDHALSVSYLMKQAEWSYGYTEGYFNFSKTNVYRTSYYYKSNASDERPFDGYNSIISKDGRIWFYTGITPANKSETNVGFLIFSPRTGEMKYYEVSGAEESSAQNAAEGLVSNMNYTASFPTIVNIEGEATYFITLKDNAGLVQRFAFCNMRNYAKCVCASTINEAIQLYKVEMGFSNTENLADTNPLNGNEGEQQTVKKESSGKVTFVTEAQIDGYTYYYFVINSDESILFISSIENSNMQPLKLQVGVDVTIKYYESSKEDGIGIVTEIQFVKH